MGDKMKKIQKQKNLATKNKSDVMDCAHNCNPDCICELETIKVCTCTDGNEAKTHEGTACGSYDCKC